jgi:hypothetical protein
MGSRETPSATVTVQDLRSFSRAIFSQSEGWQTSDEADVYSSDGAMGTLEARRNAQMGANGLSIDLTGDDNRLYGVSFAVPGLRTGESARLVACHEQANGQLAMAFGTEANQIFWAIQQAFIQNVSKKQR